MRHAPQRPGMVLFVAIVVIIVGGLTLVGNLCGGGSMAITAMAPEAPQGKGQPPDGAAIQRFIAKEVPSYIPVSLSIMVVDLFVGIGMLAAGIGLMRMSSLSRMAAIGLTLFKLLLACLGNVYNFVLVMPAQSKFFEANPLPQGAPFDIAAFTQGATLICLGIVIVIQLAVAAIILIGLNTAGVRAAFAAAGKPPMDDDEDDRPRSRYEGYDDDRPPETGITDRY